MSLRQRKNKTRHAKAKPSKKKNQNFWQRFRLGFSSNAQARRALQKREEE